MIKITSQAISHIESLPQQEAGMVWVIYVSWDRGDADNIRSAAGDVTWKHSGSRGWIVDLGSYFANQIPQEWDQPAAPNIYVDLNTNGQHFPGGVIDFDNGRLFFRTDVSSA